MSYADKSTSQGRGGQSPSGRDSAMGGRDDTGGRDSVGSTSRADRNAREGRGGQTPTGRDPAMGGLADNDQRLNKGKGGQIVRGADPALNTSPGRASTAAARARQSITRTDYSLPDALATRAREGRMHPREYEMARGLVTGAATQMAVNNGTPVLGEAAGMLAGAMGLPEASSLAGMAVDGGIKALAEPSAMHADYGYNYAANDLSRTPVQQAASMAGAVTGPAGAALARMGNFAYDAWRSQPYGGLAQSIGVQPQTAGGLGDGGGNQPASQPDATGSQPVQADTPARPAFHGADIDPDRYARGLLQLSGGIR